MAQRAENYWFEKYIDLLRDYMALRQAVEAIEKERGIHRYYKPMDIAVDTAAALLKGGGDEQTK
jgi:hypothetical protein